MLRRAKAPAEAIYKNQVYAIYHDCQRVPGMLTEQRCRERDEDDHKQEEEIKPKQLPINSTHKVQHTVMGYPIDAYDQEAQQK